MTSLTGWIKFYRKIMESPVWDLSDAQLRVWLTCLLMANNKDRKWLHDEVPIPRGSFVTSKENLAKTARVSRRVVRGALTNLERIGSIRAKTRANKFTFITVVNFDVYQPLDRAEGQEKGQLRANRGPTEGHNERSKEGKKKRKEQEPSSFNEHAFWEKFPTQDQEVIHQTIQVLHSTRKRGRVAGSIIQAELRWWDQQDPAQVIQGMRTYLEKGYADEGKGEKYLRGIIRNSDGRSAGSSPAGGKGHPAITRAAMSMTREDVSE